MENFPMYARFIYQVTALAGLAIMSGLIGSRIKTLHHANFRRLGLLHVLIFLIYAVGMIFVLSTNFLLTGWSLQQNHLCLAGIYLCLACYVVAKTVVYLFLLHRVHVSREDSKGRVIPYREDWISIAGGLWILVAVTACAIMAFLHPIAIVDKHGECTIGLPPSVTITLIGLDIHLNIVLTLLCVYFTNKFLKQGSGLTFKMTLHALPFRDPAPLVQSWVGIPPAQFFAPTKEGDKRLRMAKALWGTAAIMLPTAANLGVLLKMKGHEQGWLCMSCCIGDVLWSIIVVHWLTNSTGTVRK